MCTQVITRFPFNISLWSKLKISLTRNLSFCINLFLKNWSVGKHTFLSKILLIMYSYKHFWYLHIGIYYSPCNPTSPYLFILVNSYIVTTIYYLHLFFPNIYIKYWYLPIYLYQVDLFISNKYLYITSSLILNEKYQNESSC